MSPSPMLKEQKRKCNIQDFFPSSGKRRCRVPSPNVSDRSAIVDHSRTSITSRKEFEARNDRPLALKATCVPGLTVAPDFITAAEETALLSFLNNPARCTWRTDLSRRSMHFGGTYCCFSPPKQASRNQAIGRTESAASTKRDEPPRSLSKQQQQQDVIHAPPMPPEFDWLLDRFSQQHIFQSSQRPQYCIVNEYHSNLGISAHVENFSFGEPVVGLSLLCPVSMRFHELEKPDGGSVRSGKAGTAKKTGKKEDIWLDGRSLCIMRGESRWKWQHEICRSAKGRGSGWKRISLTFRYKEGD
ncbi:MAG: hypothetical protein M1818_007166 [Claussenomyces sp. TS43310]|nr:MAG: hypothetical protein M1818_007166 [Claussenomyces sp. TS43310]